MSFAYGVFALVTTKKLSAYLQGESNVPVFSIHINFKELAKAATCIVAMVIWIFIALSIVSNTTGGVIVLMVPCFILATAALYFSPEATEVSHALIRVSRNLFIACVRFVSCRSNSEIVNEQKRDRLFDAAASH